MDGTLTGRRFTPTGVHWDRYFSLPNPGETVIHFGKMKDKTLAEVWGSGPAGQGWVRWCANTDGKGFDPQGKPENVHLQRMARAFLALNAAYAG